MINIDDELNSLLKTALRQYIAKPLTLTDALVHRYDDGVLYPVDTKFGVVLDDLIGIDTQKNKLINNTRQFLQGLPANHALMTGTRGAGKSSLIKALLHAFYQDGLRVIELYRDDLKQLNKIKKIINPNFKYIVFCDDLAFNQADENYRTLKSVLDGAMDSDLAMLIYATSNRRHLLPQLMKDNVSIYNGQTDEINPYETIDETVSLSDRFGLHLTFYPMNQATYLQIAERYLVRAGLNFDDSAKQSALRFASERGGRSGRVAYQFSCYYGKQLLQD